jgi:hypothetical protein
MPKKPKPTLQRIRENIRQKGNSWMQSQLGKLTHIWGDSCQAIQPLITDELGSTDTTGVCSNATDLVCGVCKQIIATTYSANLNAKEIKTRSS